MKTLDEAFDIYQEFLALVDWHIERTERANTLDNGKERLILKFYNGFTVELCNDPNLKVGAYLRAWQENEKNAVEINTSEQLLQMFYLA